MYDTIQDLLNAFRATPDTLRGLLRGHSQAQAGAARGGDENWSVVEVVCHLRDAEEVGLERMRRMRDQDHPALAGYDQEQLARDRNYAGASLPEALAAFLRFREMHVAELSALRPGDWERTGQHSEVGSITIKNHTEHLATHDAVHLAQIARQLEQV